jgi:hypothetical protein
MVFAMRDVSHIENQYLRQLVEARAKDYGDLAGPQANPA